MKPTGFHRLCALLFIAMMTHGVAAATEVPRPEHPRPDCFRTNWMTLNGEWQFEIDQEGSGESRGLVIGKNLSEKIQVPFCPESRLSGLAHTQLMTNVWYRRKFELPLSMAGQRVRLHFGGVDYQTWVWLNGKLVGSHIGGSVSFFMEITKFLHNCENELVVRAFDDTASGKQPTGKQSHTVSEGCVYTRTTGIWQSVWLEAVGSSFVENFAIVPDPDHARIAIDASINGADENLQLAAEAFVDGKSVGKETIPISAHDHNKLVINLSEKKLWMPGTPFLYDLKFSLSRNGKPVDTVASYFGLRKVSIQGRSILINGQRIFQRTILDQGFYPEGIWTAPTDADLKRDIELSMAAGFNGARLHQKVFEPRYLYWADKLGYLVWGEFPNWGFNYQPGNYANFTNEFAEEVKRDFNHPSTIGWCPFNESPAAAGELQRIVFQQTRAADPTRPALETSGWTHTLEVPEVRDSHDYNQDPTAFKRRWLEFFHGATDGNLPEPYDQFRPTSDLGVPFMVSEFGGIGWTTNGGWGYGNGPKTTDEFYQRYAGLVGALLDNSDLFGFCYTQLTDVEQERNGLYYYDRSPKFEVKRLHDITSRVAAFEQSGPHAPIPSQTKGDTIAWQVLVGMAKDTNHAKPFRYVLEAPRSGWTDGGFDDSTWKIGRAPFGTINSPQTEWRTGDIWLRQTFEWNGKTSIKDAALAIYYDEDTQVYLNGELVWSRTGYISSYELFSIADTAKRAIRPGINTLAVHTKQTGGGQCIDLGLLIKP